MTTAAVTSYGWLLSLHVLAGFAVGAPIAVLLITTTATRPDDPERALELGRIARAAAAVFRAGLLATIVLGVWLVLASDGHSILDGWVLVALGLWLVIGGLGDRAIASVRRALQSVDGASGHLRSAFWLELGAAATTVAELAVMIWRPGA